MSDGIGQVHPSVPLLPTPKNGADAYPRVQSWFPFSVDVCINGRQWLARQMDQAGIAYRQRDNCFVWIEDWLAAQKLLDQQLCSDWPALMRSLLELAHPLHAKITAPMPGLQYYWSASQSEYATDVIFRSGRDLQMLYPKFLRHAITSFQSPDVLRFLGRKVPLSGKVHGSLEAQISSRLQERPEGVRIRHSLNGNSLKMYDKEGSVLRVETTIVRPREFRIYRAKEGDSKGQKSWRILRKGVSDMYRRGQVCRAANQRYLQALASVTGSSCLLQEAAQVCQPVIKNAKRYRALNALAPKDYCLLQTLSRGEFALSAIRTLICVRCFSRQSIPTRPKPSFDVAVPLSPACLLCSARTDCCENCPAFTAINSPPRAAESSPHY